MTYKLHKSLDQKRLERLLGERLNHAERNDQQVAVLCLQVPRANYMTQMGMSVIESLEKVAGPDVSIMQVPHERTSYVVLSGGNTQQATQIANYVKEAMPEQRRPATASMSGQPQQSLRTALGEARKIYCTLKSRVATSIEQRFPEETEAALNYEFA